MTFSIALLVGLTATPGPGRADVGPAPRPHYRDAVYGFAIDAPRFPAPPTPYYIPIKFSAPHDPAGTSGANLVIQRGKASRRETIDGTIREFEKLGMKLTARRDFEVQGREAAEIEMQGIMKGMPKELRQVQRVVFDGDRVLIVTCTATPESFPAEEAAFRDCLASLRIGSFPDGAGERDSGRSRYTDPGLGFQIDAPRYPAAGPGKSCAPVTFMGPPAHGFASNIAVTVGPPKSRDQFQKEMDADAKKPGFKFLAVRDRKVSGRDAVEGDVEGTAANGATFRLLTLTVLDRDRTYMVAAITPGGDFAAHEAELRACLGSFSLDQRPVDAP